MWGEKETALLQRYLEQGLNEEVETDSRETRELESAGLEDSGE